MLSSGDRGTLDLLNQTKSRRFFSRQLFEKPMQANSHQRVQTYCGRACIFKSSDAMENLQLPSSVSNGKSIRDWTFYNQAQTTERAVVQKLLHSLCAGLEEPTQERGRPRYPLADMVFCAAFKVYTGLSGRRFMGSLEEARTHGYIEKMPHYNSIFNCLENASLTPHLHELIKQSSLPLKAVEQDFAADSSGFTTGERMLWRKAKYGTSELWGDWVKAHVFCGLKTQIIVSVELSERYEHDSKFFEPLLEKAIESGFRPREISLDKAYLSRKTYELIDRCGATGYIDFKSNSRGDTQSEVWNRMHHFFSYNKADFYQHYYKRENIESLFSALKRKLGERLKSKNPMAQRNELLLKFLCHNLIVLAEAIVEFELETTFWAEDQSVQLELPF